MGRHSFRFGYTASLEGLPIERTLMNGSPLLPPPIQTCRGKKVRCYCSLSRLGDQATTIVVKNVGLFQEGRTYADHMKYIFRKILSGECCFWWRKRGKNYLTTQKNVLGKIDQWQRYSIGLINHFKVLGMATQMYLSAYGEGKTLSPLCPRSFCSAVVRS